MVRRWLRPSHALLPLLLLLPSPGRAVPDITVSGSWTETVNASDLLAGAGSDLNGTYTSNSNQASINIYNTPGYNEAWRVDVRRSDTSWPGGFTLNTRRTSSGSGIGFITGGTTYRAVGTSNAYFFNGDYDRSNVAIQFQVTGMSVQVPPATYSTTVVFTVMLN